jgi:hypothetical protein
MKSDKINARRNQGNIGHPRTYMDTTPCIKYISTYFIKFVIEFTLLYKQDNQTLTLKGIFLYSVPRAITFYNRFGFKKCNELQESKERANCRYMKDDIRPETYLFLDFSNLIFQQKRIDEILDRLNFDENCRNNERIGGKKKK